MRHFAHHIGDYAAATAHLSFVEDAAYHRLLRLYYRDEKPLPADVVACQRLAGARSKDERAAIDTMLREFFSLQEDGWHQTRADGELEAYQVRAETARENGSRSAGRPKTRRKHTRNPAGYSTDTQAEPSRTLTNNQEPITNPEAKASGTPRKERTHGQSGTRLPDDWQPTQDLADYARDRGLDPGETSAAFKDYWGASNSRTAIKRDWNAAFRTWCRRATADADRGLGAPRARAVRPARGNDAAFEHLAHLAAEGRGSREGDGGE